MKTVLLVDDSTSIRNIIKGTLEREYQVIEAGDGLEARNRLEKGAAADVILLDVNMPVMDGLTLLRTVKADERWKRIPVLMLTTETKPERRQEAKDLGAAGWVLKPCDPEQLLAALKAML
jgi:two-component system chemotaxis response regulator CheY